MSSGLITVLFTDLVGSTELASTVGDTAADELRRDHFAHLREAVAATGGTEVKSIGDALMVTYQGAADAVAGAAAMQRAVERQNRQLDRPLSMRVGVSAGDATFEDNDWFGTPVVEAARLCAAAEGGQILLTEIVRVLAGSRCAFELRPLGSRELRGLPDPVAVCEVEWKAPASDESIPLPPFVDSSSVFSFAGRVLERERLLVRWKEAAEGACRVVLVSGEPGVGKTRLVSETVREAHHRGATVLWGRCDEELGSAYEPFVEALRQYVAVVSPDRLRAELGTLGGELSRILPELPARVSGLAAPVQTEADTERHRLFEAVTDFLGEMSQVAPVVLVLDDVHWADKASLLLLRHIVRASAPMRVLILATYRDTDLDRTHPLADVLADLRRSEAVERVDLRGLDLAEVTDFMTSAAGHDLDEAGLELARSIHDETQGNPFFAGEVLRHLAESGAIFERDGRWTSDLTLGEVGIPEGIREVVSRRLSRLSDAANSALAVASVIGADFDLSTIESAGGPSGDELFDALDEAVQAAIIREVPATVGKYTFRHALVRSTLYEEIHTNRRVRMHWRVGEAIEARHAHDVDLHLDQLAFHFGEGALAGDALKAADYCRRAAGRAMGELAFDEAARHLDHALGALDLVERADPLLRCDLQISLAEAYHEGSDDRCREVAFAAAANARAAGDPGRLASAALVLISGDGPDQIGTLDDELIALLEECLAATGPEPTPLRTRLLSGLAIALAWGGDTERRVTLAREALAMARSTQDARALGLVLVRGWALLGGREPFYDEMATLSDEAESVARERDDPVTRCFALRAQGFLAACRGDGVTMDERLDAAERIIDGLRRPVLTWRARNDLAARCVFKGDLERAERLAMEAVELGRAHDLSDSLIMSFLGAVLYETRMGQGRIGELVPILEGLVESQPGLPVWRIAIAAALVESGRVDEARPHFDFLVQDDFANVPADVEYPVTICGLGRVSYLVAPPDTVLQSIYARLSLFDGHFNFSGSTVTDPNGHGLAMAAAALGNQERADRHFEEVIGLCERAGARAKEARCHLDWASVRADRGDHAEARRHAEIAFEIGTALGMDGPAGVVPRAAQILEG